MTWAEALLLAVVQGLTEFLPVSSSGHLVLLQALGGSVDESAVLYDVLLHAATAAAIVLYFRDDLLALVGGLWRPQPAGRFAGRERRLVSMILVASLPTAVIGLAIERWLESSVTRPGVVGSMLLVTAGVLWWGRGRAGHRGPGDLRASDALAIGAVQGLAVLPGISRSGTTITAGILRGLDRDLAARFSLWISLPAIGGATLLKGLDAARSPLPALGPMLGGMVVAAVVGYLAIGWILRLVRAGRFHWFAPYVAAIGALVLVILWYHR